MEPHENTGTLKDIAISNIQTSYEVLNDAIELYKSERLHSAANRTYYAMFKAISAIHALDGNSFKKHKNALGEFNKNYIKTRIFPNYNKQIYKVLNNRQQSDYTTIKPKKYILEEDIVFTKKLCKKIKEYCELKLEKPIDVEPIKDFKKIIDNTIPKKSIEKLFKTTYNQVFEKFCSHDDTIIFITKSLYKKGYNTADIDNTIKNMAPKSIENKTYSTEILEKVQTEPEIQKILIKEKRKIQDNGLDL